MVAISGHFESTASFNELSKRPQIRGNNRMVVRTLSTFFGTTFMLASAGLWATSSAFQEADMMLMRLVMSLFLFAIGAVLVQNGREHVSVEFEIDPNNAELRVLERREDGVSRVIHRVAYDEIGDVFMDKGTMTVSDHAGDVVLKLPLAQVENLADIENAFSSLVAKAA